MTPSHRPYPFAAGGIEECVPSEVEEARRAGARFAGRVLMITNQWPTPATPYSAPFIARQYRSLRKSGVDVDLFVFEGRRNPLRYALATIRFLWRITRVRYDLIHAQHGQSGIPALFSSIPLVVTFRGTDLQGIVESEGRVTPAGRVLTMFTRRVARKAARVILVSAKMSSYLPPGIGFDVIPSGLDLELFRPMSQADCRRELGLAKDGRVILFGGRPSVKRKRYDLAMQAITRLRASTPAEVLILDGEPIERVPLYINAADVVLLTSVHEGSPNIVKEALACNRPVVTVRVGDVEERLKTVAECVVCEDDKPETIAVALTRVLGRTGLEFDGRKHVLQLDEERTTASVVRVYQEALQRSKSLLRQGSPTA